MSNTSQRQTALDVAAGMGRRLADDETLARAVRRASLDTSFPAVGWRSHSLAAGLPSLALLSAALDRLEPGRGWDRVGHSQLQRALDAVANVNPTVSLFSGLAGVGFAAQALAAGRDRYERLLASIDAEVAPRAQAIAARLGEADGCGAADFDVISGVSGVGAYLLLRRDYSTPSEALLSVLTALATLLADTSEPRRWHTPAEHSSESMLAAFPDGHHNCGLAHGLPGPLALLSIASLAGVEVDRSQTAIGVAAHWLAMHADDNGRGPDWPNAVAATGGPQGRPATTSPSRPTWCYGSAGVARSLWLAGEALDHDVYRELALRAMRAAVDQPLRERGIISPTFCHGIAGVLQITTRFAGDTGLPEFADAADTLLADLLAEHEPGALLGYRDVEPADNRVDQPGLLDGACGIALVLLTAGGGPADWDRAFLLS
ncbi:lanthionine synthetase C family protein [Humibacillus xanthopallidus]|uniref:lanthionine synthetase C family protein n=1 Tax=Humibacillus xanthopallidus TaxID=412689 RepID=UPI00163A0AC7|nr:lanthionine synthetase C family protein [Humibacillus xanthopallidus]